VDPTDYVEVYRATHDVCHRILDAEAEERRRCEASGGRWRYYVYLQPGTGQMQTVWVLLVQAGLLPATMLSSPEGRYRLPSEPPWREVTLTLTDFPAVVSPDELERRLGVLQSQNESLRRTVQALEAELAVARAAQHGGAASEADGTVIPPGFSWLTYREALERRYYALAYEQAGGDVPRAAALLGLPQPTFRAGAARLGIRARRPAGRT
jgi:hypothetical protein